MNKYKPTGWKYESVRHSLAAKGIKTKINYSKRDLVSLNSYYPKPLGMKVSVEPGRYEQIGYLENSGPYHSEKYIDIKKPIEGIVIQEVWEGAYVWNVLFYDEDTGQDIIIAVLDKKNIKENKKKKINFAELNYKKGDIIEYVAFGGIKRRVKVENKEEDVKNGEPGFDGYIVDEKGNKVPDGDVWGYDSQITQVLKG